MIDDKQTENRTNPWFDILNEATVLLPNLLSTLCSQTILAGVRNTA